MGSVAVFGAAGLVGSCVTREFAHVPDITTIHLVDVNARSMEIEATDAAMVAEKLRAESLEVRTHVVDMMDEAAIASFLTRARPDVVVQAATPRNWYSFPAGSTRKCGSGLIMRGGWDHGCRCSWCSRRN